MLSVMDLQITRMYACVMRNREHDLENDNTAVADGSQDAHKSHFMMRRTWLRT